ncbi:MAG TPA: alpha-amylase family glycosyl hydrolase [Candidatus Paceibacterota bacterium]|nr:alpha-amylase family glycosyl hydrolase [Candidatus Paceibacterota bacterium]
MSWLESQPIIYQIFLDRFARSGNDPHCIGSDAEPSFCGGNIRGVIERIPYLEELGIDALWITPCYATSAYHGYHITDFFSVDPRFGSEEDLRELIAVAHRAKIRILLDFVPNHVSSQHPYFLSAQSDAMSPYREWFTFTTWPNEYLCFLQYRELPKLNLEHPAARAHVVDAAKKWLSLGADGLRLDHTSGPSSDFWKAFSHAIRSEFPDAVLFGEEWMLGTTLRDLRTLHTPMKYLKWLFGETSDMLQMTHRDYFDGILDFYGRKLLLDAAKTGGSILRFARHLAKYPLNYRPVLFIDNHDMDRLLFTLENDENAYLAIVGQMIESLLPVIIYQGDERGVTQERACKSYPTHGDLAVRRMIDWSSRNEHIYSEVCRLIAERRARRAQAPH